MYKVFWMASLEFLSLEQIQAIAKDYGYWTVFVGIALENTGVPIPGETIILVSGFLAGSGELNYWLVLASAITGAVLGDNFGYWLGKWGGWSLLVKLGRFFRISEIQLQEAKTQFSNNAPRAVFFGRFVALLRIFAGPMAGIADMPYSQFLLCNFGGATLWASITVSAAYFLGAFFPLAQVVEFISKFSFMALLLVCVWIGVPYFWENRKTLFNKEENQP